MLESPEFSRMGVAKNFAIRRRQIELATVTDDRKEENRINVNFPLLLLWLCVG